MFDVVFLSCWQYGYGSPQVSYASRYIEERGLSVCVLELRERHKKVVKAPYPRIFVHSSQWLSAPLFILLVLWSYLSPSPIVVTTSISRRWLTLLSPKTKFVYYALEVVSGDSKRAAFLASRFPSMIVLAPNKWRLAHIVNSSILNAKSVQSGVIPNYAPILREPVKALSNNIHVLIQGQIGYQTYGLELLKALPLLDSNINVSIYGPLDAECNAYLQSIMPIANVKYYGHVLRAELRRAQREASIGVCLWRQIDLATEYAAPNKFYEYLSWGIACITSDNKSLHEEYRQHPYGAILNHVSEESISCAINDLARSPKVLAQICDANKKFHMNIANFQACYGLLDKLVFDQ